MTRGFAKSAADELLFGGSYKKTVSHRRGSFDGACCHREALLDDATGELVLFQCPRPRTFGWVGIFVGLVVVRVLKEDFVEGMAMYTDVEFFQGFMQNLVATGSHDRPEQIGRVGLSMGGFLPAES